MSFAPWVGTSSENGALIKPKRDIIASARELGYKEVLPMEDLYYNKLNAVHPGQIGRRVKRKFFPEIWKSRAIKKNIRQFSTFFDGLTADDTLFLQYPLYCDSSSMQLLHFLLDSIPKLTIKKKIILVHDMETLDRSYGVSLTKEMESTFIKSFDHVILHNKAMVDYYMGQGDVCRYHTLDIFDYRLQSDKVPMNNAYTERSIYELFYAGNLMKASFLSEAGLVPDFDFHVYGMNFPLTDVPKNVIYHGAMDVGRLIGEGAKYGFGLVWDGDSIDELTGMFGTYMKYNNPYKLSANIASGLPIITSRKAGIASFIEKNKLGILVDSLRELSNIRISNAEYEDMSHNVRLLQRKIVHGEIIKTVLRQIES